MIIPIKCVTCGKVLADKYIWYCGEVRRKKIIQIEKKYGKFDIYKHDLNEIQYFTKGINKKTIEGEVLDDLGLNRYCCRRVMLTHVDII